jgi:hypothetical protein
MEIDMQSLTPHVIDYVEPRNDGESTCIAGNIQNIKKLVTMQLKLIKLLLEDKMPPMGYIKLAKKYSSELQTSMEIRGLYLKKIKDESLMNGEELESVLLQRELLSIRNKIGEICEEAYKLKLAAHDWDIENLNKNKLQVDKNLSILQGLSKMIDPEDAEEIRRLSQDNCRAIKELEIETDIYEMLINNINTIANALS